MSLVAALALMLPLAGCDSGGGKLDDSDDAPATATFFAGDANALAPGEPVVFDVEEVSVVAGMLYQGSLGGQDVEVVATDGGLLTMLVPVMDAGSYDLQLTMEKGDVFVPVRIAPYEPIEEPIETAGSILSSMENALRSLSQDTSNADAASQLDDALAELEQAQSELSSLAPQDVALLAYTLSALDWSNVSQKAARPSEASMYAITECDAAALRAVQTNEWIKLVVAGGGVAAVISEAVALSGPVGWIIGIGGTAAVLYAASNAIEGSLRDFAEACLTVEELELEEAGTGPSGSTTLAYASTSRSTLEFRHDEAKRVTVLATYGLADEVEEAFEAYYQKAIVPLFSVLPSSWGAKINSYVEDRTERGAPDDLALSSISDDGIAGTMEISGEETSLTFRFSDEENQPAEPQQFTFDLVAGDATSTHEATLELVPYEVDLSGTLLGWHYDADAIGRINLDGTGALVIHDRDEAWVVWDKQRHHIYYGASYYDWSEGGWSSQDAIYRHPETGDSREVYFHDEEFDPWPVAVAPDGRLLFEDRRWYDLYEIPAGGGEPRRVLPEDVGCSSTGLFTCAAYSPSGRLAVLAKIESEDDGHGYGNGLMIDGTLVYKLPATSYWGGMSYPIQWTADGSSILLEQTDEDASEWSGVDHRLYRYDLGTGTATKLAEDILAFAISPDGAEVAVGGYDRQTETSFIQVIGVRDGEFRRTIEGLAAGRIIAWTSDGHGIIRRRTYLDTDETTIEVLDARNGEVVISYDLPESMRGIIKFDFRP